MVGVFFCFIPVFLTMKSITENMTHERVTLIAPISSMIKHALLIGGGKGMLKPQDSKEASTMLTGGIIGTDIADDIKKLYLKTFSNDRSSQARKLALIYLVNIRNIKTDQKIEMIFKKSLNDRDSKIRETTKILNIEHLDKKAGGNQDNPHWVG